MPLAVFVLAVALSVDGLVAGTLYGVRRVEVPGKSIGMVGACCALGVALSMLLGDRAAPHFSEGAAETLGGVVLVGLGLWRFVEVIPEYLRSRAVAPGGASRPVVKMRLRSMGVVIHILVDPMSADQDASGRIDTKEAVALGVALGLDSLAAGFAAGMLRLGLYLIPTVAMSSMLFLWLGVTLGRRLGDRFLKGSGLFLPALVLITMGILHL